MSPGEPTDRHDGRPRRIVVAITGATGVILGVRFLEACNAAHIESHLIVSEWAARTIRVETPYDIADLKALAGRCYREDQQAAAVSSGSFRHDGMVIIPCTMNTLAHVAHGLTDTLIPRAADVTLKEVRKLVLVPRETPFNRIHLRNMLALSEMGVAVVPPMLTFYNHPESINDLVWHIVARVLDQLGIDNDLTRRWADNGTTRQPPARTHEVGDSA